MTVASFALSEEQAELVATVRSVLAKHADPAAVRAAIASPEGYDPALWRVLCEQVGVAALPIPEEYDGAGATFFETAIVLEELGRSLAPSPLLATTIASQALLSGGSDAARQALLPRIAAGEPATLALAPGPVLDGDRAAIVLTLADGRLAQVEEPTVSRVETMDQTIRLAEVSGSTTALGSAVPHAELVAAASVAALAVGLCQRALDMTVTYAKEREQFGRPIGSFQALKHRMADMLVRTELARSATWSAAYALAVGADDAADQVSGAAAYALEAATALAGECIQLHGGIAITWEHDAHLVFKRAHALSNLFVSPRGHRRSVVV